MNRFVIVFLLACCASLTASLAQTAPGKTNKGRKTATAPARKVSRRARPVPADGLLSVGELQSLRMKALEEIELTSRLLGETSADARNSLNRLNLLSQQLLSRKRMLTLLEREIAAVDMTMKTMSDEIELLRRDLVKTKENYARSMQNRQMELRTAQHKILLVLSADNFAQSYRRLRYLREYADWQKEEAGRIVDKQNEMARRKAELEKTRDDKLRLLSQRAQESKTLEAEKNLQQREVALLNKKRKGLQTQLQQKKKEAEALNRQIESLIAEDIENSEKLLPDAPSATPPTPPTASSYRMTDADLHLSNDFAANKGRLPYPLTGKCVIVSSFGEHQHQELTYVRTNNDGIDLRTTAGAEACAVFKGLVTRVFIMPGYNQNVIVRHGNYLTVYSNLSTVYVKAGDVVETRQPIGKIFTDTEKGHETILHFQIRKERTKLNPVTWIRR